MRGAGFSYRRFKIMIGMDCTADSWNIQPILHNVKKGEEEQEYYFLQ